MRSSLISSLLYVASMSAGLGVTNAAIAQEVDTSKLEALGIVVDTLEETSIDGLYQITSNQGIFYVSEDGTRLIAGNMFDVTSREPTNLTEQAMADVRREQLKQVEDEMIVYPSSKEKYEITVFTDTTCGYCQRLHENLGQYLDKGITVRYLAFPRGGINSKGGKQLQSVWCADDPADALTAVKDGDFVDSPSCNNPVENHYRMGQAFGVTGTPAMVLPDGRLLPGLRTADALLAEMNK
ncbi:bifunctional protein-disulfide isomerase/oxidoreductase DsbC [Idiomarina seosinensis]|uniref:Thiol:disulfide interchange protein n=1 Tax=Idiomarina seosinensis TaxID=281739 RepID=A0A432ZHA6_9GAMM|nr:bifunctional protein-disulfide isomerase/oxidoreductase DsbC [Idiomarina seosinensis]RUO77351.1 bifunctional protein-disulfide isomerase/oxidoreductase DsbC [Idiomarina seosinensis]